MALPYPAPDDITQPFWDGVAIGELRIQSCDECDVLIHLPELACPHCGSESLGFATLSGQGTLQAWTRIFDPPDPAFSGLVPFTIGIVELAEQSGLLLSAPFADAPVAAEGPRSALTDAMSSGAPLMMGERIRIVFAPLAEGEAFVPQLQREGALHDTHA